MKFCFRPHSAFAVLAVALTLLAGCRATQVKNVSRDPAYDPATMRNVFVAAVVTSGRVQKMFEDEFVSQLRKKGKQAVPSYTVVKEGTQLEPEAWKQLMADNGFDTVIIVRLVELDVKEKDISAKINMPTMGSGYGYYQYSMASIYQPSSYIRDQTAFIETRVIDVASGREVWSGQTKTKITWGADPNAQIRNFVKLLMQTAKDSGR